MALSPATVKISGTVGAVILLVILIAVAWWSAIDSAGIVLWIFEVFPALIGVPILIFTYRQFRFTLMVYLLVCIHSAILCIGGHYTYAEVPLFNWIRDYFGHKRNSYDKLGHFAQGFIPAIIIRELLLRTSPLQRGKWLTTLIILTCLGLSGAYEIIEWWASAIQGKTPDEFLGSQGDVWDAQKDMLCAVVGASCALLFLSSAHDRALRRLSKSLEAKAANTNKNE